MDGEVQHGGFNDYEPSGDEEDGTGSDDEPTARGRRFGTATPLRRRSHSFGGQHYYRAVPPRDAAPFHRRTGLERSRPYGPPNRDAVDEAAAGDEHLLTEPTAAQLRL